MQKFSKFTMIFFSSVLLLTLGSSIAMGENLHLPISNSFPEVIDSFPADKQDEVLSDQMTEILSEKIAQFDLSEARYYVNNYEWDALRGIIIIHAHSSIDTVSSIANQYLPDDEFEIVLDKYNAKNLQVAIEQILHTRSFKNFTIVWGGVNIDGESIDLGVVGIDKLTQIENLEIEIAAAFNLPFSVNVVKSGEIELADRQYHTEPYIGGALISSANTNNSYSVCSSGFSVIQYGTPLSATGMLFADHCGDSGKVWSSGLYTNSPYFGTAQSMATGGADIKMLRGDVSYHGLNFVNGYNSNTAIAIKGYSVPMVNKIICMNGSQSGSVCSNVITHGPMTISVNNDGTIVNYNNLYRSVQSFNKPAAGNGDSGGPVIHVANNQVYALGIISATENPNNNCSGKPATPTRKCSSVVYSAGLNAFFDNNPSWSILTYP